MSPSSLKSDDYTSLLVSVKRQIAVEFGLGKGVRVQDLESNIRSIQQDMKNLKQNTERIEFPKPRRSVAPHTPEQRRPSTVSELPVTTKPQPLVRKVSLSSLDAPTTKRQTSTRLLSLQPKPRTKKTSLSSKSLV